MFVVFAAAVRFGVSVSGATISAINQMKKKNDLFLLIGSMTKAEKRYFKLYASKHVDRERSNSVRLFEAIEAQASYDEQAIRKRFAAERFSRQLAVQKNYLFSLILKSLRQFHAGASPGVRVAELLHSAEILADRGLYELCDDLLERARQIAITEEEFALALKVSDLSRRVAYCRVEEARMAACGADRDQLLQKLENLAAYTRIIDAGVRQGREDDNNIPDIDSRLSESPKELLGHEDRALSKRACIIRHNLRFVRLMVAGDHEAAEREVRACLRELESFPEIPVDLEPRVVVCYFTLMQIALLGGRYQELQTLMRHLENMPLRSHYARRHLDLVVNGHRLSLVNAHGNFASPDAAGIARSVEAIVASDSPEIRPLIRASLQCELARYYFAIGEYAHSLAHTNGMIHRSREGGKMSLPGVQARVHAAMLQYELGNNDTVEYAVQAVRRYLARIGMRNEVLGMLLTCIRRIAAVTPEEVPGEATRFQRALERRGHAVAVIGQFMILEPAAWLTGKRCNRRYADAYRDSR